MATLCSNLKYYGHATIGVVRDIDKEIIIAAVSHLYNLVLLRCSDNCYRHRTVLIAVQWTVYVAINCIFEPLLCSAPHCTVTYSNNSFLSHHALYTHSPSSARCDAPIYQIPYINSAA